MAISLQPETHEVLDLPTFVDHIKSSVDFRSEDSILQASDAIASLANNRTFLADWLNEKLTATLLFPDSGFVAGVTALAAEEQFLIRANVWSPPRANSLDPDVDNLAGSYLTPHDHNFTFLTVGYAGSGYTTDIYEYHPERVHGYAGETVGLEFLEKTSLPEGKVMLYRESRDVHIQHHSNDFSISLNILSMHRRFHNTQRFFDLATGRIVRAAVDSAFTRSSFVCRMAGLIGDDETFEFLDTYRRAMHNDSCSKWYAVEACTRLREDQGAAILEEASHGADPYVARRARALLLESDPAT